MRKTLLTAALFATAALASPASAVTYTYVGSWTVDQGPSWSSNPAAYTGQEAAALLFGGTAANYAISTIGSSAADIDFLSWVSTWGGACGGAFPCGTKVAESFKTATGGFYLNPGDTSAYVNDWAVGSTYTNYAFSIGGAVPEPATWALMILGFGGVAGALRRRKVTTSVAFA